LAPVWLGAAKANKMAYFSLTPRASPWQNVAKNGHIDVHTDVHR
jgi:hypothetical protein